MYYLTGDIQAGSCFSIPKGNQAGEVFLPFVQPLQLFYEEAGMRDDQV
jgi:hypothetical protein